MERWEIALNTFLDEWRDRGDVIGVLVCGSYVTGNPTSHSDIDVHIILADGTDWRERGNRIVDGYLIEYFANPPGRIRRYFSEDYSDNERAAATQLATGRAILDKNGTLGHLKEEAWEWIGKPFERPADGANELARYTLWDNVDDLRDADERRTPDFAYTYHHALEAVYRIYAKFLGQPVVGFAKVGRCLRHPEEAKRKYLMEPFPDEHFARMFLAAIDEMGRDAMLGHAEELTAYVINAMGGFDIDGWAFRSPA